MIYIKYPNWGAIRCCQLVVTATLNMLFPLFNVGIHAERKVHIHLVLMINIYMSYKLDVAY